MDSPVILQYLYSKEVKKPKEATFALYSPTEEAIRMTNDDTLRMKFLTVMDDGVPINDEIIPYPYIIEKLHSVGRNVINKKTKDAKLIYVYEIGTDSYEVYWVHQLFLSLQSFQFFKVFEKIKYNMYDEKKILNIEVPSLEAFRYTLYLLYTGDKAVIEFLEQNETLYQGMMDNIDYLEIVI